MPLNEGHEYREQLGPASAGQPLIDYLSRRYPHSSAAQWRERIVSGQVLLDAQRAEPEFPLRAGQVLTWRRPAWDEPEAPVSMGILHEDPDLLAVDKPAGLPTLPGAGYLQQTLLARVRERHPHASPVHRLGRWTSGIVLFACVPEAAADLARQWREGTIVKDYRALASGAPASDVFTVRDPIGRVPHARLGEVHGVSPAGKPATTHVTVLERRGGEPRPEALEAPPDPARFLCDVRIETGRPHQIRIHLAAAGHPLVGDPLYGAGGVPAPDSRAVPGDPGYHLHAAALSLRHPRSGAPLTIRSVPPPILRRTS